MNLLGSSIPAIPCTAIGNNEILFYFAVCKVTQNLIGAIQLLLPKIETISSMLKAPPPWNPSPALASAAITNNSFSIDI